MEIAEKNYLLSEIKKYDEEIAGMSWCTFGVTFIKSNKRSKNILFLIISLVITIVLCLPYFIYLGKVNKRKKLINEYVFKEYIENNDEIVLSSIYKEIEYGIIRNYIKKISKKTYILNADKTRLNKQIIEYDYDIRLTDLKNELIILSNSNHNKAIKRKKEINKQIVTILYQSLNMKSENEICDYCNNVLFVDNISFNTIYYKYVKKILKKLSK